MGVEENIVSLRRLRSLWRLRIVPKFPTISIGRARYFRNPQSVVPAIFASAKPRTHPPPRRGLGGGSGLELPAKQAGVASLSRAVRLFYLANSLEQNDKN